MKSSTSKVYEIERLMQLQTADLVRLTTGSLVSMRFSVAIELLN